MFPVFTFHENALTEEDSLNRNLDMLKVETCINSYTESKTKL